MSKLWDNLPQERKRLIVELLVMESESNGGWIDPDLWDRQPEEAQAQVDMIQAAADRLYEDLDEEQRRALEKAGVTYKGSR